MVTTGVYANMLAVSSSERLDAEKLRRVVECKTTDDAFKMLGDYGYAYGDKRSIDGFIAGETDRLIAFVEENAHGGGFAKALTARFVYNNAKLAYKSRYIAVPSDGYYSVDLDVTAVASGEYDDLDPIMAEALTELDEQLKASTDAVSLPQTIDLALTRAMYKQVLSCGPSVKKFFRTEIDLKNILSAARMKKLGLGGDMFIDGGTVDKQALFDAVEADGFAECFERTRYADYAADIADGDFAELWRAESDADAYLFCLTADDVKSYSSHKPFLNFYIERLIELKTVKTALVCIKTNSRDVFYARLPQLYR